MKSITKTQNLNDPYIVAGNRMYSIANQNGKFPRIGWHVEGEMAGVWAHPIKLFNEYNLNIFENNEKLDLEATTFNIEPTKVNTIFRTFNIEVVKSEFVPDDLEALVIDYKIKSNKDLDIKVAFNAIVNIIGTWTVEDAGYKNGSDEIFKNNNINKVVFKDSINPWFAGIYAFEDGKVDIHKELLYNASFNYDLSIKKGETKTLSFIIFGSSESYEQLNKTLEKVSKNTSKLKENKAKRYEEIKSKSEIIIDNKEVKTACEWLKYNADMMIREIPNLGRGYGAGFPYYPWWFGTDACYTIPSTLSMGQHEESKDTLRLIKQISDRENGNGRIVHETSTFDVTYNKGNTQETPHFVKAVNQVLLWTGDVDFIKEMYNYCKKGTLEWLLGEMDEDKDLLPTGYGIIELYCLNLEMLDVAVLTCEALEALLNMANVLNDKEVIQKCEELIPKIKEEIDKKFWMEEEGLYADMSGSIFDMRERVPHLINNEKMDTYKKCEMEHYFSLHRCEDENKEIPWLMKNWITVCPLEAKLVDEKRAKRIFERLESTEFTNEHGLQLCGVKKDYEIEENEKSDDIYALDIAMSISSGVMAYAESLYSRVDQAFEYTKKLSKLLYCGMPGAISENLPDKGCFLQSWSSYGVNWTIASGIMGIIPDAYHKTITIKPILPRELNYIEIKKMLIGAEYFDIKVERLDDEVVVCVNGMNKEDWIINIG
ncbi:TPA: hypothetical protein KOS16_000426 [Clostridioides difficile]|nr:hypothetical protein [Clostridioides difficile]